MGEIGSYQEVTSTCPINARPLFAISECRREGIFLVCASASIEISWSHRPGSEHIRSPGIAQCKVTTEANSLTIQGGVTSFLFLCKTFPYK